MDTDTKARTITRALVQSGAIPTSTDPRIVAGIVAAVLDAIDVVERERAD